MKLQEIAKIKIAEKNLSYSKIAKELGISVSYVSDILKEKRNGGKYKSMILEILEIPEEYENIQIKIM